MRQSDFKLKGTPTQALLGATIGFFFGVMAISLFGPTSTTLCAAMGLGATQLGLLVSVPSLTGSLLRIPFGAMVDSNGGRRGFLFLLAAAVVGLGALSVLFTLYPVETPGSMKGLYPVVLLLGCLAGCGIATFSVGASQSNYWFAKNRQGYASGTRYLSLLGGACLSFYDFYCDLPPSSPQTWGEQTDVPESADWYNSSFLLL